MWEENLPVCTDCHEDKDPKVTTDVEHKVHGDSISCQACHAQASNNCFECHLDPKEDGSKLQTYSRNATIIGSITCIIKGELAPLL